MSTVEPSRAGRRAIWVAALLVATAAGVATAHGLYQVAAGAGVPAVVAWLYPLITDGLALVAYAATARLHHAARRYAAGIVIAAAGLSGLAQAVYLAGALDRAGPAPVGLRFGVGAWPAVAAALTAHLLHLIGTGHRPAVRATSNEPYSRRTDLPPSNAPSNPVVQPRSPAATTPAVQAPVDPASNTPSPRPSDRRDAGGGGSARERARAAAQHHHDRHGGWPTVTELMSLATVARGTAGTALKDLRAERPALHVVNAEIENRTNS